MQVNFVYEVEGNGWAPEWIEAVVGGLTGRGWSVHRIDLTRETNRPMRLHWEPTPDIWFSQAFVPWVLPEVVARAAVDGSPVVASYHGGVPHRCLSLLKEFQPGQDAELKVLAHKLDALFVNLPHNVPYVAPHYDLDPRRVMPVGYPIRRSFNTGREREKTIIVPGRLHEEKGTYLAAHILEPFQDSVHFVTPTPDEAYENALRTWGYKVSVLSQVEYWHLLETTDIVFTASMSESCSVAMVEAHLAGCKTITPAMGFFGQFSGSYQYVPYDIGHARSRVLVARNKPRPVYHDMSWYDAAEFAGRVSNAMESVIYARRLQG